MVIRVGLAPRRAGLSVSRFQEHWRTEHADRAAAIPGLRRYVQNHAVLRAGRPLLPYPGFDACAETEFDSVQSMTAGFASEQYQQAVRSDEAMLIDKTRFFFLLCERRVCIDGPARPGAVKLLTFLRSHPASAPGSLHHVLAGRYAAAVAGTGAPRHEQLLVLPAPEQPGPPPACQAVDVLWYDDGEQALAALSCAAGNAATEALAGVGFGTERLIARPVTVLAGPNDPPEPT